MATQLCPICFNTTDNCTICNDPKRNKTTILVVEHPSDVDVFENTGRYKGVYHVLHGVLSPRDGIGPDQLRIHELVKRVQENNVKKLIFGIKPSQQGDATIKSVEFELLRANVSDVKMEVLRPAKNG